MGTRTNRELRAQGLGPGAIFLIAPMDEIPHYNYANKLLDVWSHPLLNPNQNDVVANIHLITPALP